MLRATILALLVGAAIASGCDSEAPTNIVIDDTIIEGDTIYAGDHYSFAAPMGLTDDGLLTVYFHTVPLEFYAFRNGRMYFTAPPDAMSGTIRAYYNGQRIPFEINHLTVLARSPGKTPRITTLTRSGPENGAIVLQVNGELAPAEIQINWGESKLPIDSVYTISDSCKLVYTRHYRGLTGASLEAIVGKGLFFLEPYIVETGSELFPQGTLPAEIRLSGRIYGRWKETFSGRDETDDQSNSLYHELVMLPGEMQAKGDSLIFTRLLETDTISMRFAIDRERNELSGVIAMRSFEMDYLYTHFELEFANARIRSIANAMRVELTKGLAARQIKRIDYTEYRGPRMSRLERFNFEGTDIGLLLIRR